MPAVLDEICADVQLIEELERKIYTPYSKTASYLQFLDYRSDGDTRLTINGSRHYKTPYGALPSVTTILSATSGNKAALERWAKKNPGGREAAAARGTRVHSLMEEYLLGIRGATSRRKVAVTCESATNQSPSTSGARSENTFSMFEAKVIDWYLAT